MKVVLLLSFVALGVANPLNVSYNLKQIRPIIDTPEFQARYPHIKFPDPFTRITGGSIATQNQFPYQAYLIINVGSFCGGSLISNNYAMTAAHCVDNFSQGDIVLGALNIYIETDYEIAFRFSPSNIKVHPNWNPLNPVYDIAVIHLPSRVEFTASIKAVPLPKRSQANIDFTGSQAIVSGWGRYSDASQSISEDLRYVQVPIISNYACSTYFNIIQDSNICTNGTSGRSPCNGDSGGPLTVASYGGIQVGIVSFGAAAGCQLGYPAAFARVTFFIDFLDEFTDVNFND